MKTYRILYKETSYHIAQVKAETCEKARKQFELGEHDYMQPSVEHPVEETLVKIELDSESLKC